MAILRAKARFALAAMALLGACAEAPPADPAATAQSILQSSTPAHGSTVVGPVDSLELRFSPPARLLELTVTGSDGLTMPMMVTAVGEVARYSIPLSGLQAGAYTVNWRAAVAGTSHSDSFRFTVR
ncbi:copper resistance CopC family protein [Sphingomonas sp.]|uniref:copper resistance CopC family protein n=1 Tax=Sphingomonas sp. TaxID=28214 RepID=UPI001836A9C0|nr:copper resistance CopC family protein [Sphingomonas sp.]MBA3511080.1 copper resistance protein CopC [Sphingomonas sp.]